jgi:hypothetical protein
VTEKDCRIRLQNRPAPMRFLALPALEVTGVHRRGFASPASFHLQGFAPSWRFAPPETVRACFIPVALVGFLALRSIPLPEVAATSSVTALPACRWPKPSFRVLIPPVVRCQFSQGLTRGTARCFLGFRPLQGLPHLAIALSGLPPTCFR